MVRGAYTRGYRRRKTQNATRHTDAYPRMGAHVTNKARYDDVFVPPVRTCVPVGDCSPSRAEPVRGSSFGSCLTSQTFCVPVDQLGVPYKLSPRQDMMQLVDHVKRHFLLLQHFQVGCTALKSLLKNG